MQRSKFFSTRAAVGVGSTLAVCLATTARANDEAGAGDAALRADDTPSVHVVLSSPYVSLPVSLYHPDANLDLDLPFARCRAPCFARVPVGRYTLRVGETNDTLAGSRMLEIQDHETIRVDPISSDLHSTGLLLGIGGIVVSMLGAGLFVSNVCLEECRGNQSSGLATTGLVLELGGMVASTVGWVNFFRRAPAVDVTPLDPMGRNGRN